MHICTFLRSAGIARPLSKWKHRYLKNHSSCVRSLFERALIQNWGAELNHSHEIGQTFRSKTPPISLTARNHSLKATTIPAEHFLLARLAEGPRNLFLFASWFGLHLLKHELTSFLNSCVKFWLSVIPFFEPSRLAKHSRWPLRTTPPKCTIAKAFAVLLHR
jgi:hypothetical protein